MQKRNTISFLDNFLEDCKNLELFPYLFGKYVLCTLCLISWNNVNKMSIGSIKKYWFLHKFSKEYRGGAVVRTLTSYQSASGSYQDQASYVEALVNLVSVLFLASVVRLVDIYTYESIAREADFDIRLIRLRSKAKLIY